MTPRDATPGSLPSADLSHRLRAVKSALEEIEKELTLADGCPDGLDDFKVALDHIRLSAWALLTAAETHTYQHQAVLARFRMSRGIDICEGVMADLRAGTITPTVPEFDQFHAIVRETLTAMETLLRQYEHEGNPEPAPDQ